MPEQELLMGLVASLALAAPFLLPIAAPSSRSLWMLAFAAFVPAAVAGGLIATLGADVALPLFLGLFASALLGTLARRTSLIARGFGHPRPYSLWIEAIFVALVVAFILVAGL